MSVLSNFHSGLLDIRNSTVVASYNQIEVDRKNEEAVKSDQNQQLRFFLKADLGLRREEAAKYFYPLCRSRSPNPKS